jgi:hypothetical protein
MPRPLEDFLECSRAEERRVRRVAWRLKRGKTGQEALCR